MHLTCSIQRRSLAQFTAHAWPQQVKNDAKNILLISIPSLLPPIIEIQIYKMQWRSFLLHQHASPLLYHMHSNTLLFGTTSSSSLEKQEPHSVTNTMAHEKGAIHRRRPANLWCDCVAAASVLALPLSNVASVASLSAASSTPMSSAAPP